MPVQAADMLGGVGAAVGDHQKAGRQRQVLLQEVELFGDGAAAIALAVQTLTENRQTTQAVNHGGESDLNHEVRTDIAVADMGRRQERIAA